MSNARYSDIEALRHKIQGLEERIRKLEVLQKEKKNG